MANFRVRKIKIDPIKGVHLGSNPVRGDSGWSVADHATLNLKPLGPLIKISMPSYFNSYLFELEPKAIPLRFGAICYANLVQFDKVNIFFHPAPTINHGYMDSDYPDKGTWPYLYRYMTEIGAQLGMTGVQQVFIMPYFTLESITKLGIFPDNWIDIVKSIIQLIKLDITGLDDPEINIKDLIVSSYSFGITPSHIFKVKPSRSITPLLREVWDLDGYYSIHERNNSIKLHRHLGINVLQYSQLDIPDHRKFFFVPLERWGEFGILPTDKSKVNRDKVHNEIYKRLFFHAFETSTVG